MTAAPQSPKKSRAPWIVAGVLGCLVLCIVFAFAGVGIFVFGQPSVSQLSQGVTPTRAPFGINPTSTGLPMPTMPQLAGTDVPGQPTPPSTEVAVQPTAAPTSSSGMPTTSLNLPTLPAGQPTKTTQATGQPTLALPTIAQSTAAPTVKPTAAPTAKPTNPPVGNYLIAFSKDEGDAPEAKSVWIVHSDGTGAQKLLDRCSHPILSGDGNKIVVYHWTDGLWLINATDPQKPTADKLVGDTFTGGNYGSGDWSHDGRWIAYTRQPGGKGNIVTEVIAPDKTGQRMVAIGESPTWSPDDTMVAFHTCRGSQCGIYKGSINGGDAIPVATDDGGLPAWSPVGDKIVYQKDVDGQKQLFVINADGSGKKQLTQGPALHVDANWSPDGAYIFYRSPEGGNWAIWRMNADGSNRVKLLDNVAPVNWPYERLSISR